MAQQRTLSPAIWMSCLCTTLLLGACSSTGVSTADPAPAATATTSSGSSPVTTPTSSATPVTTGSNSAPAISGTPAASVLVGSAYTFTPTANDADGNALTFSIQNLPSWATFSTSSGRLAGAPSAASVGTYSAIRISVSDGVATSSLPVFAIAVTQVASGSATLAWMPPTQNTDGSILMDLAGYRIYYGSSSSNLSQSVSLTNIGLTSYVVGNLPSGTWYFGMRAYNSAGVESDLSNIATKIVQ